MALIENSKGRLEGSGYERLFGNSELGHLLSRVQATVISSGTELEKIIVRLANNIDNVDAFLSNQTLQRGVYLISKGAIKNSTLATDREPDLIIFKITDTVQHCYIIELKDGDTFDTKKAAGEVQNLLNFENHLSKRIRFTTSIHICSFNQLDKDKIVSGFKKKITIEMAMTGIELCDLLNLDYNQIIGSRIHEQVQNIDYFVGKLLDIESVKKLLLLKLNG